MSEVRDDPDRQRYELTVGGETAIAAYRREGRAIVFTHTVVPDELRGQGVGTTLIAAALADADAKGLEVIPECPFVAAYLQRQSGTAG